MPTTLSLIMIGSSFIAAPPEAPPQPTTSQSNPSPAKAKPREFHWVTPQPKTGIPGLRHAVFDSPANGQKVGYYVYLPPGYDDPQNAERRYPVVYALHGGRPGGEDKYTSIVPFVHEAMTAGNVPPAIYVFPNGGVVSHYDYPKLKSFGETAFIKELIPLIDRTYRTIASREGRAIEGFSQGGRATARDMFKYPELFCSAAPMGGGHQYEKHISENGGDEGAYQFEPGNNTYELAERYAKSSQPRVRIFVVVGDKDANYRPNLDWMDHLQKFGIISSKRILPGVPHSQKLVYEQAGREIMQFHADNFAANAK
jgi:enterochelin esterase-like enzyme